MKVNKPTPLHVCLLGLAWEILKTPYFYAKNWQKKTPKAKG